MNSLATGHVQILGPAPLVQKEQQTPLYTARVPAGFPSPADDHLDRPLDLHEYLISNEAATFMVRVSGDSMSGAGILDGDILVVDRSLSPRTGHIVVAVLDGELTVKRLTRRGEQWRLEAAHDGYPPLTVRPEQEFLVWGVVAGVVRRL
ncbi:LexA family protein [Desulfohalobium retbaense]|uniref:Peptidase S24, S26A and S26B, conserved region n=1 Tax=Desulfohalobium retbaense (strain ATCC 49708 / DSM 5692 / JCM 16813 / HR100) TaxID=485915 RepID=C8X193_DESRD|nr:translesion error-prone DNA polymerase V autoproteolytic subunit [Desulfohalobium retbaense]ACV68190.1 Peptidase S24, S26A and S26B, conserved region [Desulfohalobium retbaense DSM 5692]